MKNNMLIAYATKYGATAEVAQAIGEVMRAAGAEVVVEEVKSVSSLDGCQAIIIGSAIRFGAWLPEADEFLRKYQARLTQMPVAIFTVHVLNLDNSPASQQNRQAYTAPVKKLLTPAGEAYFAGKVDLARLSFSERLMTKATKAAVGDLRDWEAIRAWANQVYPVLTASSSS